jgi:hypothetical protein
MSWYGESRKRDNAELSTEIEGAMLVTAGQVIGRVVTGNMCRCAGDRASPDWCNARGAENPVFHRSSATGKL